MKKSGQAGCRSCSKRVSTPSIDTPHRSPLRTDTSPQKREVRAIYTAIQKFPLMCIRIVHMAPQRRSSDSQLLRRCGLVTVIVPQGLFNGLMNNLIQRHGRVGLIFRREHRAKQIPLPAENLGHRRAANVKRIGLQCQFPKTIMGWLVTARVSNLLLMLFSAPLRWKKLTRDSISHSLLEYRRTPFFPDRTGLGELEWWNR